MTARLMAQLLGAGFTMLCGLDATGTKDVTACCLRDVMQPFSSK